MKNKIIKLSGVNSPVPLTPPKYTGTVYHSIHFKKFNDI
jgi:hypothetical protein